VIDRAPCPVLTFQDRAVAPPFRLRPEPGGPPCRALVPTDLTPASAVAVGYACALARRLSIHVELLHVMPDDAGGAACDRAYRTLDGLVPPDLVGNVSARVRHGEPGTEITRYVEVTSPAFVLLGEHARGLLRHLLTPDTTQAVLRRIECPAWVVPASTRT
jgi:nucleotide-binding universal stress UspA family protein